MTRVTKMCYVCTEKAIEENNINIDGFNKTRCAVILGIVNTGDKNYSKEDNIKNRIIKGMNNATSAWISLKYKLEGPNFTISTACASSAYAIAMGYDYIKYDKADVVIVGGADSVINPYEIEGFNEIFALSTRNNEPEKASRPFNKDRDGFVIGEGAGILILESERHAAKRNAKIFAELAGYGISSESYNIMAPENDGLGMAKTMELAIKNSNINKEEVDYINAHGTSTTLNDKFETQAVKNVFGDKAKKIPISSSKSMIGHTIGGAGAIEAVITTMSIVNGIITPTINYNNPDPELDLDYVPNYSRKKNINIALSNSFAFGGHNATLVFKKYE
jgi:3-oxoacyl-[acyl-carrier-protein] synthase II